MSANKYCQGRKVTYRKYRNAIVEVAPNDVYDRCHFKNCELVGVGPAKFSECIFADCPPHAIDQLHGYLDFDDCDMQ